MSGIMIKSQSAMEYLMTYGWAILIIAVVLAALFELGVFNPMTFAPKAAPGSCQVVRPEGPGTTNFISLEGECNGELPQYVAQFNGATHNIISVQGTIPALSGPMTVTMWVYWYGGTTSGFSSSGAFTYGDYCGKGFAITVEPLGMDACDSDNYFSGLSAPKDRWAFIAFTLTGMSANSIRTWYLNTQNVTQPLINSYSAPVPTLVYMGDDSVGTAGEYTDFNGSIANVQFYNTSLSANEIKTLYLEGIGGAPINIQNLVGWWPLNGNTNDYSGNGNNGMANGVTYTSNWYSGYTPP